MRSVDKPFVEFKLLREGAALPKRGSIRAGGLDIFAPTPGRLHPGEHGPVPLGIAHQINDRAIKGQQWLMQGYLISRSGLARDWGFKLLFDPCLIDHDYRGEIVGIFINTGHRIFQWDKGERLCQILYHSGVWCGDPGETKELNVTERGIGGFGSTGR